MRRGLLFPQSGKFNWSLALWRRRVQVSPMQSKKRPCRLCRLCRLSEGLWHSSGHIMIGKQFGLLHLSLQKTFSFFKIVKTWDNGGNGFFGFCFCFACFACFYIKSKAGCKVERVSTVRTKNKSFIPWLSSFLGMRKIFADCLPQRVVMSSKFNPVAKCLKKYKVAI
ncbi:hypothetical protein VULLAG_LOCUS23604 [Vulpes lagopus]